MKIIVYAICKNEQKFAKRFMENIKNQADNVYVTDTGSTDNTIAVLREEGAIVNSIIIDPFRFDIARNISLDFVPQDVDVCFCLDLDEMIIGSWRDAIEKQWTQSTHRMQYQYVWNVLPNQQPGLTYWYDKIHARNNFRWVKPVHEILQYCGSQQEHQVYCHDFTVYHYPDKNKSRGNYMSLLKLACKENPNDDRSMFYLGREYMYYGMHEKSIATLKQYLLLETAKWDCERSAAMRFIGREYIALNKIDIAEKWLLQACDETPNEREPWVELGILLFNKKDYFGGYNTFQNALAIKNKPMTYICEEYAWNGTPWDGAGICAYHLGLKQQAISLIKTAIELEPDNKRIQKNLQLIQQPQVTLHWTK